MGKKWGFFQEKAQGLPMDQDDDFDGHHRISEQNPRQGLTIYGASLERQAGIKQLVSFFKIDHVYFLVFSNLFLKLKFQKRSALKFVS